MKSWYNYRFRSLLELSFTFQIKSSDMGMIHGVKYNTMHQASHLMIWQLLVDYQLSKAQLSLVTRF